MILDNRYTQIYLKRIATLILIIITVWLFINHNVFLAAIGLITVLLFTRIIDFSHKYIKNTRLSEVISEVIKLFNSAHSEINIFTGKINPKIYGHPDVYQAIENAAKRGVSISIITDVAKALKYAKEYNCYGIFELADKKRIQIYDYGKKASEYHHFMVIDSLHYRMEKEQHTDDIESEISRPASIQYRNIWAKLLDSKFKRLVDQHRVCEYDGSFEELSFK